MSELKILYEIKTLEKLINRNMVASKTVDFKEALTSTQIQILDYLLRQQTEEIFQRDLESILNLRRATVSGVLQTMEKNHLIYRVMDENDKRIKKIVLNPMARKMVLIRKEKIEEFEQKIVEGVNTEELQVFQQVLKKMQKNVLEYSKEKKERGINYV